MEIIARTRWGGRVRSRRSIVCRLLLVVAVTIGRVAVCRYITRLRVLRVYIGIVMIWIGIVLVLTLTVTTRARTGSRGITTRSPLVVVEVAHPVIEPLLNASRITM